jgi:hypothetical protein
VHPSSLLAQSSDWQQRLTVIDQQGSPLAASQEYHGHLMDISS